MQNRVDFIIVDTTGSHEILACPECGKVFEIDAHTQENMIFDETYKGLLAKCPDCGVLQKDDES
jgi:uncharacterized C2H2 Zn-finger protein